MSDAERYRILREHIAPRMLYDSLRFVGRIRAPWRDLPAEQSITEKIDDLCDTVIAEERK